MSRHWSEYEYISAEDFWIFIDEQSRRIELLGQQDMVESSELCKLMLLGRREMLDAFSEFLHNNETTLKDIVVNQSILTEEEVDKIVKEEYGI